MSKGPFARAVRLSTRWGSTIATVVRHIPLPCLFSSSFSLSSGAAGRYRRGDSGEIPIFFLAAATQDGERGERGGVEKGMVGNATFPGALSAVWARDPGGTSGVPS
jgi:hypothetical protein